MHRYERLWDAYSKGHLTKQEAAELSVFYLALSECEYGVRWQRFLKRTGLASLFEDAA